LASPFGVNHISTDVPSSHVTRIDFGAVALRTTIFASSHFFRFAADWNASNSLSTGTANVRLFDASHVPLRRCPRARIPLMRS
jgi:hypothetical protein